MVKKPARLVRTMSIAVVVTLIQPWLLSPAMSTDEESQLTPQAAQCADILGIRHDVEEIVAQKSPDPQDLT